MNRYLIYLLFFLFYFLTNPLRTEAQFYREQFKVPPLKVFEKMLDYAKNKQYNKLTEVTKYIKPLESEIHKRYVINVSLEITHSINSNDDKRIQKAILKLIYFDMNCLLNDIIDIANKPGSDNSNCKLFIRFAYADYLLLSPEIAYSDEGFIIDREIKNLFRKVHASLGTSSPYSPENERIEITRLRKYSDDINNKILTVMTELKEKGDN